MFESRSKRPYRAFKSWFKKSQVVNTDGTPKILYHGTIADHVIESFCGDSFAGWFAETPQKAEIYTKRLTCSIEEHIDQYGAIYPVYLRIQQPLDLTTFDMDHRFSATKLARIMNAIKPNFTTPRELQDLLEERGRSDRMWGCVANNGFAEWVSALGCDGVKAKEGGQITWAPLDSDQVEFVLWSSNPRRVA